ncbi:MAG TPA: hypothetical protein VG329_09010 [Candidatus Dormibacteraeota bacterium]|nr:hypothetical protein [Candidatus Dormibacteraeota bacterium]
MAAAAPDQVRVVLAQDAVGDAAAVPSGVTVLVDPEYDQIMELIEWADKVVAW